MRGWLVGSQFPQLVHVMHSYSWHTTDHDTTRHDTTRRARLHTQETNGLSYTVDSAVAVVVLVIGIVVHAFLHPSHCIIPYTDVVVCTVVYFSNMVGPYFTLDTFVCVRACVSVVRACILTVRVRERVPLTEGAPSSCVRHWVYVRPPPDQRIPQSTRAITGKCCVGWVADWLVGWLVGWSGGWLIGWLTCWLVGWLVGRSVGWLVGWQVPNPGPPRHADGVRHCRLHDLVEVSRTTPIQLTHFPDRIVGWID